MPSCAVFGCNNYNRITKGTDIRYFRFPKNDFSRLWVIACRRKDEINLKNACICSVHFDLDCFEDISLKQKLSYYKGKNHRNLKPDAIPTLKLPDKINSERSARSAKRIMLIAHNCISCSTNNTSEDIDYDDKSTPSTCKNQETVMDIPQNEILNESNQQEYRMSEADHSLSLDDVKLEDNFSIEELSFSECRNDDDTKNFQMEFIEGKKIWKREDFLLPNSWKSEALHSPSVNEMKLEDESSKEESLFVECRYDNGEEDSKNFQDQIIEGKKICKTEDFILPENCKSEAVHPLSVDELKLEDNSNIEESTFIECRHDEDEEEDSKSFQEHFIEGEKLWNREDFILPESCVSRFDEEQGNEMTFPEYSEAVRETNLDNCHRSEISATNGIKLICQIGNVNPKNYMGGNNSAIECRIDYIHREGENQDWNMETSQKRKVITHIDDECTTTLKTRLELNTTTAQDQKLQSHIDSVRLKLKNHKCHLCDYATAQKHKLRVHIDGVHLKLRNHKCHLCNYAAAQKHKLRVHMDAVHLKLKNHKCHLCEYTSSYNSDLETHINSVHLKLKHHKCRMCDYTTSRKQKLQAHIDGVHLKLKNHKCQICDFTTTQNVHLKAHINNVHLKLKNHKCNMCEYATTSTGHLKSHIKKVHLK